MSGSVLEQLGFPLVVAAFLGTIVLSFKGLTAPGELAKSRWTALALLSLGATQSLMAWDSSISRSKSLSQQAEAMKRFPDLIGTLLRDIDRIPIAVILAWGAGVVLGMGLMHAVQVWRLDATIVRLNKLKASA